MRMMSPFFLGQNACFINPEKPRRCPAPVLRGRGDKTDAGQLLVMAVPGLPYALTSLSVFIGVHPWLIPTPAMSVRQDRQIQATDGHG